MPFYIFFTDALQPAEDTLRETFRKMGLSIQAFSSLYYVGVQTLEPPTSFNELMKVVQKELANNNVRSPRNPSVIFNTIKVIFFDFHFYYFIFLFININKLINLLMIYIYITLVFTLRFPKYIFGFVRH